MSDSGNTTVPGPVDDLASGLSRPQVIPALVIAALGQEPDRSAETALLDGPIGSVWIVGRSDPGAARSGERSPVSFGRHRPGSVVDRGPLTGKGISHEQLEFRLGPAGLTVENVGRAAVWIDGQDATKGHPIAVSRGSVIVIHGYCVLVVTMRPPAMPDPPPGLDTSFPWGEPDANGVTGESFAIWAFRVELARAIRKGGHVLFRGESGVGKELGAKAIHRLSRRRGKLVAYNAAALPDTLAESMLFGNRRAYPNPGTAESIGLFGEAEGRVLFLDEISGLAEALQEKLLRAIGEGEVTRLGERTPRKVDVLVVVATNRPLSALRIKEDLVPRFPSFVHVPSLAERIEDIVPLARALVLAMADMADVADTKADLAAPFVISDANGRRDVDLAPGLVVMLLRRRYPGNVRDLRNLLVAAVEQSKGPPLLPPQGAAVPVVSPSQPPPEPPSVDDLLSGLGADPVEESRANLLTKEAVKLALDRCNWHRERTAEALGISRHALRRLMKRYGLG